MSAVVLVTGATRGLGRAIVERLHADQWTIVASHHRTSAFSDSLKTAVEPRGTVVACNLGTVEGIDALIAATPSLDAVVLNAGIAIPAAIEESTVGGADPLREQLDFNLHVPLLLLRTLLRAGRIRPGASVVVMSSNLARRGLSHKVAYCAAKAGLEGACRALAAELGPRGIRVNAVAPGLVRTQMTHGADFETYAKSVPLRRAGVPGDIAGVVAFLLGDDARYVTGQVLDVDGGWSAAGT